MSKVKVMGRALEVLLVEDNPGDALLVKEYIKTTGFPVNLSHVQDGQVALDFVRRKDPYAAAPRPDLVLLDLVLPGKNGLEVLMEIKQDPGLKTLSVMVMTGSGNDMDMALAYKLEAVLFMPKPMNPDQFQPLLKFLREIWIKTFHFNF